MSDHSSNELLIRFMKHYLNDNSISISQQLSEQQVKELHALSAKHDMAHLVGVVAEKFPPEQMETFKIFAREQMKAMFRYEKTKEETEKILGVLETAQIPHIPLKGTVIRGLYQEPWHRTSCDIDILVPEERLNEAIVALQKQLEYENKGIGSHDVSMWSTKGVHLELHFDIDETHVTREQFWENAEAESGHYCYRLSNEMLIVSHIAHMAKHFLLGGCGLRPFLDLWLMQEKLTYDETRLEQLLRDSDLQTFAGRVHALLDYWFRDGDEDALLRQMEEFILPGGVYGNVKNGIAVTRTRGYGAGRYLIRRLFPPLKSMQNKYYALNKHPWLLPWFWICRIIRLVRSGKARGIGIEYRINRDFSAAAINNTDHLLKSLGLKG